MIDPIVILVWIALMVFVTWVVTHCDKEDAKKDKDKQDPFQWPGSWH